MIDFIRGLPKAELHVHIEGTLEPEMTFELAAKNRIDIPFDSVMEIRAAYEFDALQPFLDIYHAGAAVLVTEDDFAALMSAYLERAIADGVRHAEVFFDPQTHTGRGVDIGTVFRGFAAAQQSFADRISTALIMCFLRHLSAESAVATFHAALPYLELFIGVGMDSSEKGYPPERFTEAYALAAAAGLHLVAHAGEEGPPEYIWAALDVLGVERIDHGVRAEEDPALVARLVADEVPLTMCPVSNQKLKVFPDLADHNLKRLLDRGVVVSINSDDPSYFGAYIADNYLAAATALDLSRDDLVRLAKNSIESSFLSERRRRELLAELHAYAP